MTNEEKAKEIACVSNRICSKNCENEKFCGLNFGRKCALEAMQWKDEQHAIEKQQWIEKACDVYCKDCEYIGCDKFECLALEKFRKAMEEQL